MTEWSLLPRLHSALVGASFGDKTSPPLKWWHSTWKIFRSSSTEPEQIFASKYSPEPINPGRWLAANSTSQPHLSTNINVFVIIVIVMVVIVSNIIWTWPPPPWTCGASTSTTGGSVGLNSYPVFHCGASFAHLRETLLALLGKIFIHDCWSHSKSSHYQIDRYNCFQLWCHGTMMMPWWYHEWWLMVPWCQDGALVPWCPTKKVEILMMPDSHGTEMWLRHVKVVPKYWSKTKTNTTACLTKNIEQRRTHIGQRAWLWHVAALRHHCLRCTCSHQLLTYHLCHVNMVNLWSWKKIPHFRVC